ncbi:MAG: hypothetical protein COZ34_00300, partial [Candidatus Pacebacteria bacterium CG_4_10_14_3_um_filter_34_15]
MKKLKSFLLFACSFIFLALTLLSTTTLILAVDEIDFRNTIESTYTVNPDGVTKVSHHIKITNLTPTLYLKQYALKTSYFGLTNIVVKDKSGNEIDSNKASNETGTSIGITFEDQLVGQGKARDFFI